ncbi:rhomboid family intramembrane serine protease [Peribacillus sp. SCS-155]|uniref:rhomboid family intramembrane serine protease n=1 Tax=Peribacillus sedimenti TaxID=3115297 RepID=UPI003906CDF7
MGLREDYIFWSLVNELSSRHEYRMLTVAENHNEIWLENDENKAYPVIRVMRHDLDWANWLKRDIDRTVMNAENIRSQLLRRPMNVLNIYISAYLPVDDFDHIIRPVSEKKSTVHTMIFDASRTPESFGSLEQIFNKPLSLHIPDEGHVEESHVAYMKQGALAASVKKTKEEQAIFRNGKPFFTNVFIFLQIAIFILMELKGSSQNTLTLIQFGAKYSPLILQGEWWRFFTPMVVHIGVMHLLMNTLSLYFIGPEVERMYGRVRFLFIYIFAGFSGTLASFLATPNISAGASGAIFGLFGALLYFGTTHPKLFFRTMGTNIIILIIINLGYGFSVEGVDNSGHIGGLIGGFLASGVVHLPKKRKPFRQAVFAAATAILTFCLLKWGYTDHPILASGKDPTIAQLTQEYIKEGDEDKAFQVAREYIENFEQAPYAYFSLGNMEIKKGNLQQAKEYYEKAIAQYPEMHEAHYNLALVYNDLGDKAKAMQHIREAVNLEPDQEQYREMLRRMEEE